MPHPQSNESCGGHHPRGRRANDDIAVPSGRSPGGESGVAPPGLSDGVNLPALPVPLAHNTSNYVAGFLDGLRAASGSFSQVAGPFEPLALGGEFGQSPLVNQDTVGSPSSLSMTAVKDSPGQSVSSQGLGHFTPLNASPEQADPFPFDADDADDGSHPLPGQRPFYSSNHMPDVFDPSDDLFGQLLVDDLGVDPFTLVSDHRLNVLADSHCPGSEGKAFAAASAIGPHQPLITINKTDLDTQPEAPSKKRDATEASGPIQTVWRAYGSKRCRLDETSRVSTARTRQLGSCPACKKKKQREEFSPCGRCARTPMHLLYRPCCRIDIVDVKLFRLGSTALDPTASLQKWMQMKASGGGKYLLEDGSVMVEPPRKVRITHDVCTTTFEATIMRYQPGPNDKTAYFWEDPDGNKQKYELPPYYIVDLDEVGRNLRRYIWKAKSEFPNALLAKANPIIRKTFKEAERYYAESKSELVAGALMFWSATRMIERFWLITGDDMLGIPPMKESIGPCRMNPYIEAVPVTPIMDTQLDEVAIDQVLIPLKSKLLRLLSKTVLQKNKENWYEIYLASFIILHSSEIVLGQVMDYSRRYGISFMPRSNDGGSLSQAYYHACKIVLVYFYFATGGTAPLSLDWLEPGETGLMTPRQLEYLRDMKNEIKTQNERLQNLKNETMYENEMFWCHQLLFADWKVDTPYSGNFLTCTDKDFLLS